MIAKDLAQFVTLAGTLGYEVAAVQPGAAPVAPGAAGQIALVTNSDGTVTKTETTIVSFTKSITLAAQA